MTMVGNCSIIYILCYYDSSTILSLNNIIVIYKRQTHQGLHSIPIV